MKIRRFPRLRLGDPLLKKLRAQNRNGNWTGLVTHPHNSLNRLTKRQKKVIRLIINGEKVKDACRAVHPPMDDCTYYKHLNRNPKFQAYYRKCAEKAQELIEMRLDAKTGRAVRVIENALDSPDQYYAHDASVKLLTGRGVYRKSIESKKDVNVNANIHGQIERVGKPINEDLIPLFINALSAMAAGGREVKPKVVKGEVVEKIINALPAPAPTAEHEIQEQEREAKAS